jgi:8-oxo-dGTP pyrophosphatase MutT (NUDIX family)
MNSKPVKSWSVFILLQSIDRKKILLVYNKDEKKLDGKRKTEGWGLPGGGVDDKEIHRGIVEIKTALRRELKEETGIDLDEVEIADHRDFFYFEDKPDWINKDGISRIVVLVGRLKKEVELQPQPGADVTEAKWFNLDEIFRLNIYRSHLRRILYLLKMKKKCNLNRAGFKTSPYFLL